VDEATGEIKGKGDASSVSVQGGVGKYEVQVSDAGNYTLSGVIRMKRPDGTYSSYPFKSQYEVLK